VFKGCFGLVSLSNQGDAINQKGSNMVFPPSMICMKVKNLVQAPLSFNHHMMDLSRAMVH
jgi:hypothetical protein